MMLSRQWDAIVAHKRLSSRLTSSEKKWRLPTRTSQVRGVVLHTTGYGIVDKAIRAGEDPAPYAAAYYARLTSYASHMLVTPGGFVIGTVPEDVVAYHVGISRERREIYAIDDWTRYVLVSGRLKKVATPQARYKFWQNRWGSFGYASPRDIFGTWSVNSVTIGIDLLPGVDHSPGDGQAGEYTVNQIQVATALVASILSFYGLRDKPNALVRHSDVDPLTRTTYSGPWDLPTEPYNVIRRILGFQV